MQEIKVFVAVLCVAVLMLTPEGRSCTEMRASYRQQSYTMSYASYYTHYYRCGSFWRRRRCSTSRSNTAYRTAYRTGTSYRTACCNDYTCGSNCQACCSSPCQNGGTCDTPNHCICAAGWTGTLCQTDVNECLSSNRCDVKADCRNTSGSYTCTCRTGYQGNGYRCTDIDECRGSNRCSRYAACHNTAGSYTCSCRSGYRGNGYTCSDVNECTSGHTCDSNASCSNTVGSYTCSCNLGYTGNGFYCNDINECLRGTHRCHLQATCTNTVGSYTCSCNTGYHGSGITCVDINECSSSNGGCDQVCSNVIGSYQCSCRSGYYLQTDRHSCGDVNECATQNGGCHHNCHNTVGSYHCSCNDGYTLGRDDHTCSVPPLPPTNLEFSRVTTRTAHLSWRPPAVPFLNSLTSVSSYRIVARQGSFNISDIVIDVRSSQTTYTFPSTLEEFTEYSCEVHAGNSFGYGRPSSAVQFQTLEAIPSAPPRVDVAIAQSPTLISLHWLPPPSIHINGRFQYYQVNITETNTGKKWTFYAVESVLRVGSLHPDYVYAFTITARTIGFGPYSSPTTVRTGQNAPSGAPRYLRVASKTSTSFTLTWQPPPLSQQNGAIQFYTLTVQELETNATLMEFTTNDTNITLDSLHPYYYYESKVRAENILPGPFSEVVVTHLDEDAPSSSPTVTAANATGPRSLYLEWGLPPPVTHNGVIRSFTIVLLEVDTGLTISYDAVNTSKSISSLHPYYVYQCEVHAFTVRNGPPSEPVYITTLEDVPSGAPLNISVSERGPYSLYFSWQEPRPELQNGILTSYIGILWELPELNHVTNVTSIITEAGVSDLRPHTNYMFRVAALNSVGSGPISASYYTNTEEDAPSGTPHNVSVDDLTTRHTHLSWDPPHSHLHNGIIREYLVELTGHQWYTTSSIHRTVATTILIEDLHPDATYTIRVAAHTVDVGPYSETLEIHTLEDVPASAPIELLHHSPFPDTLFFEWKQPVEQDRNGRIINYSAVLTELGSQNSTTYFTDSESIWTRMLRPFTAYSFSVAAATAVGFGPTSEHLMIQTAEDAPSLAPTNFTCHPVGSDGMNLRWVPPPRESFNGVLRHYQISILELETSRRFFEYLLGSRGFVGSLHPFYSYTVNMAAVTVAPGPYSNNVTITTLQDVPSAAPSVSALQATSRSVFVSWDALSPPDRNGIITGYTIIITDLDDIEGSEESYFTREHNMTLSELFPYTTYGILLSASTEVGSGPDSNLHTIQTHEEAPIGSPTNVTAVRVDSTSIHIYWDHPPEDTHFGLIREYRLNITELESGDKWREVVNSSATEAVFTELHPYYTYHITIVPVTTLEGDNYTEITLRTAEDAPSMPPLDLIVSNLEPRSFHADWAPPPIEATNGILRKYTVNITDLNSGAERIIETHNTSLEVHNAHPHTVYLVSVSAFTVRMGPTVTLEIHTPEEVPTSPPLNLTLEALTPRELLVSWQPPPQAEQNGELTNYSIITQHGSEEGDGGEVEVREETTKELEFIVEGLEPFQIYSIRVAASTVIGLGPYTVESLIEMPEAAPSSPPASVQVLDITTHNFTVEWTPPPDHTHNGIIRRYLLNTTERETARMILRETTELYFVLENLHPYYTYLFTVAAVTVSAGPHTEPMVAVTLETAPSSTPTDFTLLHITSTSFTLSWNPPPPEHHNGVITKYEVTVLRLSTLTTSSLSTNDTGLTIAGLVPYSGYEVAVTAFTSEGSGPQTDTLTLQTEQDAPSVPPMNVTVDQVLSRSLRLSWVSPDQPLLYGELTHYLLQIRELDTNTSTHLVSTEEGVELDFLHPFYTYTLRLAAVTILPGPFTEDIVVTTLEDAPSVSPVNIQAEAVTPTSVSITWDPLPQEVRNGIIRQYTILMTAEPAWVDYTAELVTNGTTELVVTGLTPFVTYEIQLNAHTISPGPFSSIYTVTTLEAAPKTPPRNVSLSILNSTIVELTWLPPFIEDRNGIIDHYLILVYEANSTDTPFSLLREVQEEEFPVAIRDLHSFYSYQFMVAAVTVKPGPFSDKVSCTLPEDAPSSSPVGIIVSNVTSRDFSTQWLPPVPSGRNGIIRGYMVTLTNEVTGLMTSLALGANETSLAFWDLHPAYTYILSIAALTVSQGPFGDPTRVIMAEDVPSGPPSEVKGHILNSTSVELLWQAPRESKQNGEIISYTVIISGNESGHLVLHKFTSNSSHIIFSQLRPFSEYNISVAADTAVGTGPFTAPSTFHTPEDAPFIAPTILSVDVVNSTSVIVKWENPSRNETNGFVRYSLLNVTDRETSTRLTFQVYNSTSKRVIELHPFYTYDIQVATATTAPGPFSDPITVVTQESAPSSPPLAISILEIKSRAVNISWEPPPAEDRNGIIRTYHLVFMNQSTLTSQEFLTPLTTIRIDILFPYQNYTFTVSAYTHSKGPDSLPLTFQTLEDAPVVTPQSFQAFNITSREFTLSWAPPDAMNTNGILRSYSLSVSELHSNLPLLEEVEFEAVDNETEFLVDSLTPYTLYNCTVAAITVAIGPTAEIEVRTGEEAPAHSPEDLSVEALDAHTFNVTWSPPSMQQNGVIRSYIVNLMEAATGLVHQYTANHTSILIEGLVSYSTYFTQVAAVTIASGPFSDLVYAATPETAPYSSPQNLSAASLTSTSITLHWLPPPDHLLNGIIRYYHILISDPTEVTVHDSLVDGKELEVFVDDLHPYFLYNCSIAAVTVDDGPPSSIQILTLEDVPSGSPSSLTSSSANNTITLSWQPLPLDQQNGVILKYLVTVYTVANNGSEEQQLETNETSLQIPNLHPFYLYEMTVAAENRAGEGPQSQPQLHQLPEARPSGTPQNLTISILSPSSVRLSWLPPSRDQWNGILTSYTVQSHSLGPNNMSVMDDMELHLANVTLPLDSTSVTFSIEDNKWANNPDPRLYYYSEVIWEDLIIEELHEYFTYHFSMYMSNSAGDGDAVESSLIQLPGTEPTGPPTNISVEAISSTAISISWEPPDVHEWNGVITSYHAVLRSLSEAVTIDYGFEPDGDCWMDCIIRDLDPYSSYTIALAATSDYGTGPLSEEIKVKTFEDVPSPPLSVSTHVLSPTRVLVTWGPPLRANGIITQYQVVYSTSENSAKVFMEITTSLSIELANLTISKYKLKVQAATAAGFGEYSEEVSVFMTSQSSASGAASYLQFHQHIGWIIALVAVIVFVVALIVLYRKYKKKKFSQGTLQWTSNPLFQESNQDKPVTQELERSSQDQPELDGSGQDRPITQEN